MSGGRPVALPMKSFNTSPHGGGSTAPFGPAASCSMATTSTTAPSGREGGWSKTTTPFLKDPRYVMSTDLRCTGHRSSSDNNMLRLLTRPRPIETARPGVARDCGDSGIIGSNPDTEDPLDFEKLTAEQRLVA